MSVRRHFCIGNCATKPKPVALVCNSRFCLLNYYRQPATTARFLTISDRPQSKIDIGDEQTSGQKCFRNHHINVMRTCMRMFRREHIKLTKAINTAITKRSCSHQCSFEEPFVRNRFKLSKLKYCCCKCYSDDFH
jgi:hypothetical protein